MGTVNDATVAIINRVLRHGTAAFVDISFLDTPAVAIAFPGGSAAASFSGCDKVMRAARRAVSVHGGREFAFR